MCRSDNHEAARGYLEAEFVAGPNNETGLSEDNGSVTCLSAKRGHLLDGGRQHCLAVRRRRRCGGRNSWPAPARYNAAVMSGMVSSRTAVW